MQAILWTPVAESDLDDILYYIAREDHRPDKAIEILHEIQAEVKRRVVNQVPGHRHPIAPEGWLYFQFKRWLIFYQPITDGIEVMRVVDGVRDLPATL